MNLLEDIRRLLRPLRTSMQGMILRGKVQRVDEDPTRQRVQVSLRKGETAERVERFGHWGFYSRPAVGGHALVLFLGGDRSHGAAIAVDGPGDRPQLEEGEACIDNGHGRVLLRADGSVEITCTALRVTGDVLAEGQVRDVAGTMQAMRDAYNAHTHTETGTETGPPVPPMLP